MTFPQPKIIVEYSVSRIVQTVPRFKILKKNTIEGKEVQGCFWRQIVQEPHIIETTSIIRTLSLNIYFRKNGKEPQCRTVSESTVTSNGEKQAGS